VEKASGATTRWNDHIEDFGWNRLGLSSKWNGEGGGEPWYVVAQFGVS